MASIHFVCPVCAQNLKVSGTLAGRKGRCPFCAAKVRIPVDDNGSAEILDPGKSQDQSDIAPVPDLSQPAEAPATQNHASTEAAATGPADAALGPSVLMRPDTAASSIDATGAAAPSPPLADSLQAQLDRQLGDQAPEHSHESEAATVKWKAGSAPMIQSEAGAEAPLQITRLEPHAQTKPESTPVPAAPVLAPPAVPEPVESQQNLPDLPVVPTPAPVAAPLAIPAPARLTPATTATSRPPSGSIPAKIETLKYSPEQNPARQSGELNNAMQTKSSGDRFVETRERTPGVNVPAPVAAAQTVPPPISLAGVPHGDLEGAAPVVRTAPPSALPGERATPAKAGSLDEFFDAASENKVGDGLASLPRERSKPSSAVAALATRGQTPNPPQVAVAPVAAMQSPVMPVAAGGAASSLIGDRCDPSRHGFSATPVIVWVALVLLTLGGITTWLVIDGLNRRTGSIQASQAFLRVTDLAAAETEYFNTPRTAVAGPSALSTAPGMRVGTKPGSEYAVTLAELQEKNLLTPAFWKDGITVLDTLEPRVGGGTATPMPGAVRLAEGNGYRYVIWYQRSVASQGPVVYYSQTPPDVTGGHATGGLDRGFAVAAIPTDATNWAYAIDERGRLIQWRYTPPAEGAAHAAGGIPAVAAPGAPSDPVETASYPPDTDFHKIPIR